MKKGYWKIQDKSAGVASKPDSVPGPDCSVPGNDHSSLDADCPASPATYPGAWAGHPQRSPIWFCTGWGLPSFPGHPGNWCALTAPFHPYPASVRGGLLSVALSFTLPRLHVMEHPALRCPDFPQGTHPLRSFRRLQPILPFTHYSSISFQKTILSQCGQNFN